MAAPEKVYKLITTGDLRLNGYHEYKPAKIRYNDKIIEYIRKDIVDEMLATAEDHSYFAGSESQRVKLEKIKENFIEKACDAYCKVCKMPNCRSSECRLISDFKGHLENI